MITIAITFTIGFLSGIAFTVIVSVFSAAADTAYWSEHNLEDR